ncbi:unnamed protein product [Miscanthus lutarioriparius]|uniref:Uncharacterized protein n=1 Tax=Miscanthus lutarioriparius TaxID=422564 RepID=A0A811S253_9POAL|nr:unnamed protein product [Miscanthus lutarioriparius]
MALIDAALAAAEAGARPLLSAAARRAAEWCEKQMEFVLERGKPEKTVAMKVGSDRHAQLEQEVVERVDVAIRSAEELWAVKFMNFIVGTNQLMFEGMTREIPVSFYHPARPPGDVAVPAWRTKHTFEDVLKYFKVTCHTLPRSQEQLLLRYELQEDHSLLEEYRFTYDARWFKDQIQEVLSFWIGSREPKFVAEEERWKCCFCKFVSDCPMIASMPRC